jgi:CRISPR-associated endonuclease Csn1
MLIGGKAGKNRLDRRHHAVDAATIAMLRPGAVQALVVRDNLRKTNRITGRETDWKQYKGTNPDLFAVWTDQMKTLASLIQDELDLDRVPVFSPLRLRFGSSSGHKDIIRKFVDTKNKLLGEKKLGDAWSTEEIDRSATPAQWCALTQIRGVSGYSPLFGLEKDDERSVQIQGKTYDSSTRLNLFPIASPCVMVRDGYAELKESWHHARIFRCKQVLKSGKETTLFGVMRVYTVDLLRFKNDDLFTVSIPPQSISMRTANDKIRDALAKGDAEYLGWIVSGDELLLDISSQEGRKETIGEFLREYPDTSRWVISGFDSASTITLRPRGLSGEGIDNNASKAAAEILKGHGWRVSVDTVFNTCKATVIRHDTLGRERISSRAHMPICWSADNPLFQ